MLSFSCQCQIRNRSRSNITGSYAFSWQSTWISFVTSKFALSDFSAQHDSQMTYSFVTVNLYTTSCFHHLIIVRLIYEWLHVKYSHFRFHRYHLFLSSFASSPRPMLQLQWMHKNRYLMRFSHNKQHASCRCTVNVKFGIKHDMKLPGHIRSHDTQLEWVSRHLSFR